MKRRRGLRWRRRVWLVVLCATVPACRGGVDPEVLEQGAEVYDSYCLSCHQASGRGVPQMAPTLVESDWVSGDEERLIRVVLEGLEGPIEVKGRSFQGTMGAQAYLTDEQVAAVLTWLRQSFGNQAPPVGPERVAEVRARLDP